MEHATETYDDADDDNDDEEDNEDDEHQDPGQGKDGVQRYTQHCGLCVAWGTGRRWDEVG